MKKHNYLLKLDQLFNWDKQRADQLKGGANSRDLKGGLAIKNRLTISNFPGTI